MIKDKRNIPVLERLSEKHGISISELEKVHDSAFKFIRRTVASIPFKDMSIEEFDATKKSFNIPSLGKFFPNRKQFIKINRLDNVEEENKSEETN